jgi:hypothetical protein
MRLTPFSAVFGYLLLSGVGALVMGAWSNGVVYAWLSGAFNSAIAIGLLWTTHSQTVESERRYEEEERRREYNRSRTPEGGP